MRRELLFTSYADRAVGLLLEGGRPVEARIEIVGAHPSEGDIYRGVVRDVLPGLGAAFVDLGEDRPAFLPLAHEGSTMGGKALHPGRTVLVQVVRRPLGGKGARLTTEVALAGRYLVLLPGGGSVAVSRRIRGPKPSRAGEDHGRGTRSAWNGVHRAHDGDGSGPRGNRA